MRDIHDREAALKNVPFLLRDFIRNVFYDEKLRLEQILKISEGHADILRHSTPKDLSVICDKATMKGGVTITVDSERLLDLDLSTPIKRCSGPFRSLAISAFDVTSCFLNSYSYIGNKGMLGENWFRFDSNAVELMSDSVNAKLEVIAIKAFAEKALIVEIDSFLLTSAIDQHLAYKKNQYRIDHLVLSKAPTEMIRYFYPSESDKDVTARRVRLDVALKGRPGKLSVSQELNVFSLLHLYRDMTQYQQCVRIAEELELDYSELWVVLSKHFSRDDGDKMDLIEKKRYRSEISLLPDDLRFSVVAGMLSCTESQARDCFTSSGQWCFS